MYSLKHVLWRGAMALSLLTLGVGGVGFQQESLARSEPPACDASHGGKLPDAVMVATPRVDEHALALAMSKRLASKRS